MKKFPVRKSYVLLAVVVLLLAVLAYRRAAVYGYDVGRDYRYDFGATQATIVPARLTGGMVGIDRSLAGFDTVFLELSVSSTLLGRLVEPELEVKAPGREPVRQAIELGGSGRRYLNISNLLSGADLRQVAIVPHRLKLADQQVRLYCFKNPIRPRQRVLVIAPHPDDAEIAAFGLYAGNPQAYIATITAGDAGRNKYDEVYRDPVQQYRKKGQLRVWNSITVPLLGGVPPDHAVNLGYFDATLPEMHAHPEQPVAARYADLTDAGYFRAMNLSGLLAGRPSVPSWDNLVGDLEQIITEVDPEVIVAPYPLIDAHPDHKYSTLATIQALQRLGRNTGLLLLYSNHYALSGCVPFGEMHSDVTLPPAFDGRIYFDSLYSRGLSPALQNDKYFALEAMNDLRLDTEWRSVGGSAGLLLKQLKNALLNKQTDYFRRAVRADELFFVVDAARLSSAAELNRILGPL